MDISPVAFNLTNGKGIRSQVALARPTNVRHGSRQQKTVMVTAQRTKIPVDPKPNGHPKHISRLELICICHGPILESILSSLSASDSSLFLSLIGLRDATGWQGMVKKYVTPIRDIPEYASWIEATISKGYTAMLIGADLDDLKQRLNDPLRYWNDGKGSKTLRLWLAVRASRQDYWRHKKLEKPRKKITNTTIIPIPGTSCAVDTSYGSGVCWECSSFPNDNRIEVVCAYSQTEGRIPTIQMCPVKHENRSGNKDHEGIMIHTPGSDPYDCSLSSPGAKDKTKPPFWAGTALGFTLPYFNMGSMKYSTSHSLQRDHDQGNTDSIAFHIEFRCFGGKSSIYDEIQGICW